MSVKAKKASLKEKASKTYQEFKKFISRGNVIDMAVGVIIGSAFGAIVTAVTNILLALCTWGVPGGISGLITPLAPTASQMVDPTIKVGGESLKQIYTASEWVQLSKADEFTAIKDMYKQYGGQYIYKQQAVIDWGALINAVIAFLIIALTLFVILKVYASLKIARAKMATSIKEMITKDSDKDANYWYSHAESHWDGKPYDFTPNKK
ncbi:MAG TPA: hypothetical protein DEA32_02845 [Firmicutes bacterium]|nr:hypothetical protein [Bacillota bacterium]